MIAALSTAQVWVLAVVGVLAGAAVGSFGCVIIERLPVRLDEPNEWGDDYDTRPWSEVLGGESRCSDCGEGIRWVHKIPVLSWILLRGRCRSCGASIPAFHPIVEFLVPAVGVAVVWAFGWDWRVLPLLWLVPVGIIIAAIDIRTLIVPTRIVWPAFFVSVALSLAAAAVEGEWDWLRGGLIGLLLVAGPLALLWFALPSAMGFGDVRLATLLGWTVGFCTIDGHWNTALFTSVSVLAVGSVLGIVFGMGALMTQGRKARVPFGPPLVVATLVLSALGQTILDGFAIT